MKKQRLREERKNKKTRDCRNFYEHKGSTEKGQITKMETKIKAMDWKASFIQLRYAEKKLNKRLTNTSK